jgi:predicted nucleic acid-binding protein
LARHAPEAVSRLHPVLDLIDLVDLEPRIRILAQTISPATVRSLDAIHLATALSIRGQLTSFVTYDKRLADAATSTGLIVDMPTR